MISKELVKTIVAQFRLETDGIHGIAHWARVLENGRCLAPDTGARLDVVELFAIFHDSQRVSNGRDQEHGPRGAIYASTLRGSLYDLDDAGFQLLSDAIRDHTEGFTSGDVTVQTCWDCDRLDLLRVRIYPQKNRLCTPAAREVEMIAWANQRAESNHLSMSILEEWGIEAR